MENKKKIQNRRTKAEMQKKKKAKREKDRQESFVFEFLSSQQNLTSSSVLRLSLCEINSNINSRNFFRFLSPLRLPQIGCSRNWNDTHTHTQHTMERKRKLLVFCIVQGSTMATETGRTGCDGIIQTKSLRYKTQIVRIKVNTSRRLSFVSNNIEMVCAEPNRACSRIRKEMHKNSVHPQRSAAHTVHERSNGKTNIFRLGNFFDLI